MIWDAIVLITTSLYCRACVRDQITYSCMHRIAYACTPLCMACLYHFAISFDKSVYSGISLLWYQCMAEWFIDHTCYIATAVGKQYIDVYLWIPFVQVTNYVRYDLIHNPCQVYIFFHHDDINKWKHFRFTGPLWGESISHRWIPLTGASDTELCYFLWSALEQMVEKTIEMSVIWDAMALIMTLL